MGWGVHAVEIKAKRANNSRLALCIKNQDISIIKPPY